MPGHKGFCCGVHEYPGFGVITRQFTSTPGFLVKWCRQRESEVPDDAVRVVTSKFVYWSSRVVTPANASSSVKPENLKYDVDINECLSGINCSPYITRRVIDCKKKYQEIVLIADQARRYRTALEALGFDCVLATINPNTRRKLNLFVKDKT